MTPKQFLDLVARMREEQKKFFRTKSQTALNESKRLEQEVDREIARVEELLPPKPEQPKLF